MLWVLWAFVVEANHISTSPAQDASVCCGYFAQSYIGICNYTLPYIGVVGGCSASGVCGFNAQQYRNVDSVSAWESSVVEIPVAMAANQDNLCPQGYYVVGMWVACYYLLPVQYPSKLLCKRATNLPIEWGTITRNNTTPWARSNDTIIGFQCPPDQYLVGFSIGSTGDMRSMGLVCTVPPNAICLSPPDRNTTFTVDANCSVIHQYCDVTLSCKAFYTYSTGYYTARCLNSSSYNRTTLGCVDINECLVNTSLCGPNSVCTNFVGPPGYACTCKPGFRMQNGTCTNNNECATDCVGNADPIASACNNCTVAQICNDTQGSFLCTARPNSCLRSCTQAVTTYCSNCSLLANCSFVPPGYTCTCPSGYTTSDDGRTCIDIDECLASPCSATATCKNLNGSYTCDCFPGYAQANRTAPCRNFDECANNSTLCPGGPTQCKDTTPGYYCLPVILRVTNKAGVSTPFTLTSTAQSPADTIAITLTPGRNCDLANIARFGATSQFRTDTCTTTATNARNYTISCNMLPGAGANLSFSIPCCLNYSATNSPACVTVSDPTMLFSFPGPTLTPATLQIDNGTPGNVVVDGDASGGTVVTMSGTNFFQSETSVFFGPPGASSINNCQLIAANATTLMCIPQIVLGQNFTFTVVVGAGPNAQTSLPGTDLLTIVGDPPVLANITGCGSGSLGCPTTGGAMMWVTGKTAKGNDLKDPHLFVNGNLCARYGTLASDGFNCTLPAGVGISALVELRDVVGSWFGNALSYGTPEMTRISSPNCMSESSLSLVNCSDMISLYIEGSNFGASGATVMVNSLAFAATHLSVLPDASFPGPNGEHRFLFALVNATAARNVVEIIQRNGAVSNVTASFSLLPCPPGYGRSGAVCVVCGVSTFERGGVCFPCPDGTSQPLTGQTSCNACPSGYVQGPSTCEPCGMGTFVVGNACQLCPQGKFSAATANAACLDCPAGSYADSMGTSNCSDCSPGSYSTANAIVCNMCPPGRVSQAPRAGNCLVCPRGTYQDEAGRTTCADCPSGQFNPVTNAPRCLDCPPGRFQNMTRQLSCTLCDVGTSRGSDQGTACDECQSGSFAAVLGATRCEACRSGYFSDSSGASACTMCGLGSAQQDPGSTSCNNCSEGTYADELGLGDCLRCPPGYFQNASGSSTCYMCPVGSFSNKKAAQTCELCQPGQFQSGVAQQSCSKCNAGWYQGNSSAASCLACPAGTASLPGSAACASCLPARFSGNHSSVCLPCPPTSIQSLSGQSSCIECTAGSSPNEVGTRCLCVFGHYATSEVDGKFLCPACPKGAVCNSAGWTFPQLTTLRGFWRPSNESANFYRCNTPSFCLGNDQCGPFRRGPMCALCVENYRSSGPGSECAPCPATKATSWGIAIAICLMLLVLLVVMYLIALRVANAQQARIFKILAQQNLESQESLRKALELTDEHFDSLRREIQLQKNPKAQFEDDDSDSRLKAQVDTGMLLRNHTTPKVTLSSRRAPNFMYKVKILIGFFQISSYLPSLGDIPWPTAFVDFIKAFTFFNFDFIPWQTVGCAASINYFSKTIIVGFVPVVAAMVLGICFAIGWFITDTSALDQQLEKGQKRAALWIQFIRTILFTVFLLYALVSKITLGMYNCVTVEGRTYLVADFELSCYDDQWNVYAFIDGFFVAMYPIGIPVAYFLILRSKLDRMNEPETILMLGFLYEAYTQSAWYWELVDMSHKLILTSIIVFTPNEQRMAWNMGIMGLYLISLLVVKPYVRKGDDRFHLQVQVTLFSLAFVGFILQQDDHPYLTAFATAAQMEALVSALLILIVLLLLGSFIVIAGRNIYKIYRAYKEETKANKKLEEVMSDDVVHSTSATPNTIPGTPADDS